MDNILEFKLTDKNRVDDPVALLRRFADELERDMKRHKHPPVLYVCCEYEEDDTRIFNYSMNTKDGMRVQYMLSRWIHKFFQGQYET